MHKTEEVAFLVIVEVEAEKSGLFTQQTNNLLTPISLRKVVIKWQKLAQRVPQINRGIIV